ncbi:arsenate reductase family protein [Sungkyunkwania multivorans]|uniref:Arsenate reductase family protein n=1 Tax=Sungkyunkwania multivorans TaxID=1173618 RepID=A0ABW3CUW9_9FLAO
MTIINKKNKEVKLFYNSTLSTGKQAAAFAESLDRSLLLIDISKTPVSDTQWVEIADELDIKVEDLINKEHPSYAQNYSSDLKMETEGWIKILREHPEVVSESILLFEGTFYQLSSPNELMNFFKSDSAGIEPY